MIGDGADEAVETLEQGRWALALGHVHVDVAGDVCGEAEEGGEQEDGDGGFDDAHAGGDLAAVHAGHGVVENDDVDGLGGEDFEARGSAERSDDTIPGALEDDFANLESDDLVVDAQHKRRGLGHNTCFTVT